MGARCWDSFDKTDAERRADDVICNMSTVCVRERVWCVKDGVWFVGDKDVTRGRIWDWGIAVEETVDAWEARECAVFVASHTDDLVGHVDALWVSFWQSRQTWRRRHALPVLSRIVQPRIDLFQFWQICAWIDAVSFSEWFWPQEEGLLEIGVGIGLGAANTK